MIDGPVYEYPSKRLYFVFTHEGLLRTLTEKLPFYSEAEIAESILDHHIRAIRIYWGFG